MYCTEATYDGMAGGDGRETILVAASGSGDGDRSQDR